MWVGRRCGNGKDASKIPIFEIGDEKIRLSATYRIFKGLYSHTAARSGASGRVPPGVEGAATFQLCREKPHPVAELCAVLTNTTLNL
jgi:hypothetical protein